MVGLCILVILASSYKIAKVGDINNYKYSVIKQSLNSGDSLSEWLVVDH